MEKPFAQSIKLINFALYLVNQVTELRNSGVYLIWHIKIKK